MRGNFDSSMIRIKAHEGGYVNNPNDPGGPTNMGITLATFRANINPAGTAVDVKNMSWAQAHTIYRRKYADPINFDALPVGVDYCLLDYAVHSGIGRAPFILQAVIGVARDGKIGEETLAALAKKNTIDVINAICDERLRFLKGLSIWPTFGKGWGRRVTEVRRDALAMARKGAVVAAPDKSVVAAPGKAVIEPSKAGKGATGTAGGLGTAEAARQAAEAGFDWMAVGMIVIGGAILTVLGWLYWNHRARAQNEKPASVKKPVPDETPKGSLKNA